MSAAVGAALAGARTMTATSSQGLALMAEVVLHRSLDASADRDARRQPRALGPINIHCDPLTRCSSGIPGACSSLQRTPKRPTS